MKIVRRIALGILVGVFLVSFVATIVAPGLYVVQFRDAPDAPHSREHLLGTDELGRDVLARLLAGTQVSLLLAPAAALLATLIAALVGGVSGYLGGWWERLSLGAADLFLSLPWLFLLLTVRAMLPLNVSPWLSLLITFALLGCLGWAASARVVCAGARALRCSDHILLARANGCSETRIVLRHILSNLKPVLLAQFLISIPVFVLTEANLGALGLGVSEPFPSWGGMLRGMENYSALLANPWKAAPLALLLIVTSCFQVILPQEEVLT